MTHCERPCDDTLWAPLWWLWLCRGAKINCSTILFLFVHAYLAQFTRLFQFLLLLPEFRQAMMNGREFALHVVELGGVKQLDLGVQWRYDTLCVRRNDIEMQREDVEMCNCQILTNIKRLCEDLCDRGISDIQELKKSARYLFSKISFILTIDKYRMNNKISSPENYKVPTEKSSNWGKRNWKFISVAFCKE